MHQVLRSPGRPIEAGTRSLLESRLGQDFSAVRVHTGGQAATSAMAVDAQAYTVGNDVVFGKGRYAPDSDAGRRLLAHELTHVVQQREAPGGGALALGDPAGPAEREAERMERGAGVPTLRAARPVVQRQPVLDDTRPGNLGPPVQELPLPPRCSFIWKNGTWSWKCEGVPGIGSTPEIPLDPRDIPDRIRDLIPKGPGGKPGGPQVFPVPPSPGSDLPPGWFETLCLREPTSILCIPQGKQPTPDQPGEARPLGKPIGVFWTSDVTFEYDRPRGGTLDAATDLTAEGARTVDFIAFLLGDDPTLRVRLVGHASDEGADAYNRELSRRRAEAVHRRLEAAGVGWQVADPLGPDDGTAGCTRVQFGVWACGESQATQGAARPEERKVAATFLRNPPFPGGPLKLTPPSLLRPPGE